MKYTQQSPLSSLLDRYRFLESVKVIKRSHLFELEPDYNLLRENRCGFCGRGLKFPLSGKIAYCSSKKCPARPKFVITIKKLEEIRK